MSKLPFSQGGIMSSTKISATRIKAPLVLKALLLLACSYCCAIYLNAATNVWQFIEAAPLPLREAAMKILLFALQPFQSAEIHAQEKLLELWLVWLFSAPLTIPLLVVVYRAWHLVAAKLPRRVVKGAAAQ